MKKGFIRSVLVNMLAAIVNGWTSSVFFWPPSSLGCPNEKATSSPRYGAFAVLGGAITGVFLQQHLSPKRLSRRRMSNF